MPVTAAAAVGLAAALEAAVGEPPGRVHPVAWVGRLIAPFDRPWTHPRAVGLAVAVLLPTAVAGTVLLGGLAAARLGPVAVTVVAGLVVFVTTSLRMLLDVASAVTDASTDDDLADARERLRALAGRDATDLDAGEVRSAVVESVAENLADGLVAPLLAFAVVAPWSVPAGAAGAAWVKTVNTADSMLGYRSKPVGWAAARLDDAVMWVPARLTAGLLALAAGTPGALVAARRPAGRPASPNSGWPMATMAAALGTTLAKPGAYTLALGDGSPDPTTARAGIRLGRRAGVLAYLGAGVIAWL